MSDRIWNGGTGDWYDATQWTTGVAPLPGEEADIYAGTVDFVGTEGELSGEFNDQVVFLGSTSSRAPAQITSEAAVFGASFFLDTANLKPINNSYYVYADFLSIGSTSFAGTLDVEGATFALSTAASAGKPGGDFVLETDGTIDVLSATLDVAGRLDLEGDFTLSTNSTLVNTGTINVESYRQPAFSTGQTTAITGGGTIAVGLGGVALIGGSVTSQVFSFAGAGGVISISNPASFQATIINYGTGDIIDLATLAATGASYNVTTGIITAVENGRTVASLHVSGPTVSGALTVTSDGGGGAIIELPNSPALTSLTIASADIAMGSNLVRATLTTGSGIPLTGAGIKIGIISSSFNNMGGANADAAAGYLPANANGSSAVDVLLDESDGKGDDEGRAMAELVHQVAPGAQIYFYTDQGGDTGMATGINQMVADGVNIIVDDVSIGDEPDFQVTGPIDTAITAAMASGVSYFTSATNYGTQYYQANFTRTATTDLTGAPSGTNYAQTFSNGTNYQMLDLGASSTNIDLQWDAPFPTTLSGTTPLAMEMVLLNAQTGAVVGQSSQVTSTNFASPYGSEPEITIAIVPAGEYVMAVYQTAAQAAATPVSLFKYILYANGDEAIDDPAASNGSGAEHGHDLVPGVNTVAASSFSNAPAFTGDAATEPYSASGPGELLFDSQGNRLATPDTNDAKPNFTAPDGVAASSDLGTGLDPFYGTSAAAPDAAAVAALMMQANTNLETNPAQVTADLESSALDLGLPASEQGAGLVQAVGAVNLALAAACYATGTRLLTTCGEVAVERLRVGDLIVTSPGGARPVQWIGHRQVDCARHPDPRRVWPVRVMAGAFGQGLPHRDLILSPDHAIFFAGALIPARHLVNGANVVQEAVAEIGYWHVQLDRHDIILAEGLPCESYLDTGNRAAFANGGALVDLHPDFAPAGGEAIWEAAGCAPLRIAGPEVLQAVAVLRGDGADTPQPAIATPICDLGAALQPAWYLSENPDVAAAGMVAAHHYAGWGRAEGRLPCPETSLMATLGLVDPGILAFTMADVVEANADPVTHFCEGGWRENRRPNAYFETAWYRATNDLPAGMNPLLHYILIGEAAGRRPSRHFDPAWYRQVHQLGPLASPLAHYLAHRRFQRVSPLPAFDAAAYARTHVVLPGRDLYAHHLAIGRFAKVA